MNNHIVIDRFDGEYAFLSNFYESPIWRDGILYNTVEHAFQAAKTTNHTERYSLSLFKTPGQAKKAGRNLVLRKDWEEIKISIMMECVALKFLTWPALRAKLVETGNAELIEGNQHNDKVWGVCDGEGRNELGKILMNLRSKLRGIEL